MNVKKQALNFIYTRWLSIILVFFCTPMHIVAQNSEEIDNVNQLVQKNKKDTVGIELMYAIGSSFIDKTGSYPVDMNDAIYTAGQITKIGSQFHNSYVIGIAQLLLAKAYRESEKKVEGKIASEEAVRLLSPFNNSIHKAQALIELGGTYSNDAPDVEKKIELYKQAATIFHDQDNKLAEAKTLEFVGDLLQLNNEYAEAIEILNKALKIYKEVGFERLHGLYSIMGVIYESMNNFVESLKYNLLAVEIGEQLDEQGTLMETIYNRAGLNYYSVEFYDQAMGYFKNALLIARKNTDTPTIKTELLNIGNVFTMSGRYKASLDTLIIAERFGLPTNNQKLQITMLYLKNYVSLGEIEKTLPQYNELLEYYKSKSDFTEEYMQYIRLGIVFYLQGIKNFAETVPYLEEYYANNNKSSLALSKLVQGEYYAYRTDSALKNLNKALDHFRRFKLLSDSLKSSAQAKQMAVLHLQFQTTEKDKNIELLTQKSQLQEASLQKERISRNVFIAGVCMLLLFSALMYNRYRLKRKSAINLEIKQNEINAKNKILTKLVDEKEWLLKEIHHRVKNNLQIVISLLNTQSKYLDNDDAVAAIKNSQHRMYVMSLIHQRLYQTDSLGKIDMNWYIQELIQYMKESFDTKGNISFVTDIDHVSLDAMQAVPLGLILNEAVSNSIKYAFTPDSKGTIEVGLRSIIKGHCELYVRDNGRGFLHDKDLKITESLGMSLMQGLTDQLEGELTIESSTSGVFIKVSFQCRSIEDKATTIA